MSDTVVLLGIVGSGSAAITLRRSYDCLPALRGVTTDGLYRRVRHPMYLSSIVIRLGYLIRHASAHNSVVFAIMMLLYLKRMDYEDCIMGQDDRYVGYARRVRFRLVPGLY